MASAPRKAIKTTTAICQRPRRRSERERPFFKAPLFLRVFLFSSLFFALRCFFPRRGLTRASPLKSPGQEWSEELEAQERSRPLAGGFPAGG